MSDRNYKMLLRRISLINIDDLVVRIKRQSTLCFINEWCANFWTEILRSEKFEKKLPPNLGSNQGPSANKAVALPLSYRADGNVFSYSLL